MMPRSPILSETRVHEVYMFRCLQLAQLGAGYTAPNPMVGAVLVYDNRIIGEGYHQEYGKAHAEVNCIQSVKKEDEIYIPQSTLYVSLEPCSHFGKTPPCADLIIAKRIHRVVVGCRDPFKAVDGRGIDKLRAAGIDVVLGISEAACLALNKRFFCYVTKGRPYIILKWARSSDGKMANADRSRIQISNEFSRRLLHKWRSESAAILIGTNTALYDDPELTVRAWKGPNPVRGVVDMNLRLPTALKLFDQQVPTIVFNQLKDETKQNLQYCRVDAEQDLISQILTSLFSMQIQSVLVEGGMHLLQSFIHQGIWDEARIISNSHVQIPDGLPAPELPQARLVSEEKLFSDCVRVYERIENRE